MRVKKQMDTYLVDQSLIGRACSLGKAHLLQMRKVYRASSRMASSFGQPTREEESEPTNFLSLKSFDTSKKHSKGCFLCFSLRYALARSTCSQPHSFASMLFGISQNLK